MKIKINGKEFVVPNTSIIYYDMLVRLADVEHKTPSFLHKSIFFPKPKIVPPRGQAKGIRFVGGDSFDIIEETNV